MLLQFGTWIPNKRGELMISVKRYIFCYDRILRYAMLQQFVWWYYGTFLYLWYLQIDALTKLLRVDSSRMSQRGIFQTRYYSYKQVRGKKIKYIKL